MSVDPERTPRPDRKLPRTHETDSSPESHFGESQRAPHNGPARQGQDGTGASAPGRTSAPRDPRDDAYLSDEQAELLRWQADQLLDEMMLGAVDISAADLDGRPVQAHPATSGSAPTDYAATNSTASSAASHASSSETSRLANRPAIVPRVRPAAASTAAPVEEARARDNGRDNGQRPSDYPDQGSGHGSSPTSSPTNGEYTNGHEHGHKQNGYQNGSAAHGYTGDGYTGDGYMGDGYANGHGRPHDLNDDLAGPATEPVSRGGARVDAHSVSRSSTDESGESGESRAGSTPDQDGHDDDLDMFFDAYEERHPARRPAGWDDLPPRRAPQDEPDTLMRSKINDADYLARRYGYAGPEEEAPSEEDYPRYESDAPRRRGGVPQEPSQIYYERQRVDREERMRSAERRPDQPMHATPGEGKKRTEDDDLDIFARPGSGLTRPSSTRLSPTRTPDGDETYGTRRPRDYPDLADLPSARDIQVPSADAAAAPEVDRSWIEQAREKWQWQDVSGVTQATDPESSGTATLYDFELAGYDRDPRIGRDTERGPGGSVAAMSVASGKKRSNLLPRMTTTSIDALHEQMAELHEQIHALLPQGHEYRERALGLLEKANTILQNDPMRSAEVEYYLQQGRGIIQRQEHANRLSGLYRERLQLYLGAWMAFTLVALLARYIFQFEFDALLAGTFGLDYSGAVLQNAAALMGSMFAGALGGSIGALLTLMRHTRQPHGFVDRKYGLRGLILPVIGLIAGAIIYLPFGLFYSLIGLDPSLNMIAASIAAICAFAFGFNQEAIYGTRD